MTPEAADRRLRPEGGDPSPAGGRDEARRLAAELRRIIEQLARVDAPPEVLASAADAARAFADRLSSMLPRRGWAYQGYAEAALSGSPHAVFDRSPLMGLANPIAPPIELWVVRDGEPRVEGRAAFTAAYEGGPGIVHGGFVAAAFDEVLGFAQTLSGRVGMTGTLVVRYRSPTPLYEELRFRAQVDRVEGRKIFTSGTCHAQGRLTAEAEAVFVAIDFSQKFADALRGRRA